MASEVGSHRFQPPLRPGRRGRIVEAFGGEAFGGEAKYARLAAVKRRYDPGGLLGPRPGVTPGAPRSGLR